MIQCNDPGNTQELIIERNKTKLLRNTVVVHVPIRWLLLGNGAISKKSLGFQRYRDLCYSLGRLLVVVSRPCGSFQVERVTLLSTGSFLRELQKHKTRDVKRNQARSPSKTHLCRKLSKMYPPYTSFVLLWNYRSNLYFKL